MKRFFAISLLLVTALVAAGCANSSPSPSNSNVSTAAGTVAPHDDSGEAPHGHETPVGDDHHEGEADVQPHEETTTPTPASATTQNHDDSKEPPHRH